MIRIADRDSDAVEEFERYFNAPLAEVGTNVGGNCHLTNYFIIPFLLRDVKNIPKTRAPRKCLLHTNIIKQPLNQLSKQMIGGIRVTGPLSMHSFIQNCLLHPRQGYYMTRDVFGVKGDFVTSPEISQMFGEMIGIWFVNQINVLNKTIPLKLRIVEFGPGRGTLMADFLRTVKNFAPIYNRIERLDLVEASPFLKTIQRESISKQFSFEKIYWYDRMKDIDSLGSFEKDHFTFYLCHEFFDALPVFQFQKCGNEWREIMVDVDDDPNSEYNFRPVLSKDPTKALLLIETQKKTYSKANDGDVVQVCPEMIDITSQMSRKIKETDGMALIIDYGSLNLRENRVRGIENHAFVSPFSNPGKVDLSTDVEFAVIKNIAKESGVKAFGPISQREFLLKMGISQRLENLSKFTSDPAVRKDLAAASDRLINRNQMGSIYRFLALTKETTPYPFEGQESDCLNQQ